MQNIYDWNITKKLYCIYIVYKTFYVLFIHFHCKDMPTAFSPLGGPMFQHSKKSLFVHDHSTKN